MGKKITLDQFLTEAEIQQAVELFRATRKQPTTFAKRCSTEIIRPNINRINADLGQQNNVTYLAYVVEYVMERVVKG